MKRILTVLIVTVTLVLAGCSAAPKPPQQTTTTNTTNSNTPPPPQTMVGNWSGNIAPGTGFGGSSIPFTMNVITDTTGSIYITVDMGTGLQPCYIGTNLTLSVGNGQFAASGINYPEVGLSGTESADGTSISGRINFSFARCKPNGANTGGNFSATKM